MEHAECIGKEAGQLECGACATPLLPQEDDNSPIASTLRSRIASSPTLRKAVSTKPADVRLQMLPVGLGGIRVLQRAKLHRMKAVKWASHGMSQMKSTFAKGMSDIANRSGMRWLVMYFAAVLFAVGCAVGITWTGTAIETDGQELSQQLMEAVKMDDWADGDMNA